MELEQILAEEEREEQEMERRSKKHIIVRFFICMIKNILNTLERR
jgi:hypothetical protein